METLNLLRSGQLAGQKRLQLACGLTEFPVEILDLADSLEILDLSNNQLRTLPDAFGQLKNLRIAFFNNNQF
ncbi:MAG: protein kinase, partial [Cyanobacteria bacterium P01_F01_bin.4]